MKDLYHPQLQNNRLALYKVRRLPHGGGRWYSQDGFGDGYGWNSGRGRGHGCGPNVWPRTLPASAGCCVCYTITEDFRNQITLTAALTLLHYQGE